MDMSVLSTQLVLNAIAVFALQHLKSSKYFPWLTAETQKLNRIIAVVAAGLTSIGVHYSFDHTTGVLMITGLTVASLWQGLCNWVTSFISQQVIFKATVSQPSVAVKTVSPVDDKYTALKG